MITEPALHEVIEGSPLVVRATLVAVEPQGLEAIGRFRVAETIRGAVPAPGEVRALAPGPHHEIPVEVWEAPLECILALETAADPAVSGVAVPFRRWFGCIRVDVAEGEERLATARLVAALVDAREAAPRAAALEALLARGPYARRAALAAIAGLERARAAAGPAVVAAIVAAFADGVPAIRFRAIGAHASLEGAEPPVAALLARLDDDDLAVRRAAIDRLAPLAEGARMGFDPGGHPDRRAIAIERWHRWWEKRRAEEARTA